MNFTYLWVPGTFVGRLKNSRSASRLRHGAGMVLEAPPKMGGGVDEGGDGNAAAVVSERLATGDSLREGGGPCAARAAVDAM